MAASDNPAFKDPLETDPSLFASAFKKNRFFVLTRREPDESEESVKKNFSTFFFFLFLDFLVPAPLNSNTFIFT